MSFQWTIIATFLYAEIALVFLLMLPFISPTRWQKLLKSRALQSMEKQSSIYFHVFMLLLGLFFFDAIRDVRRFTTEVDGIKHDTHSHFESDLQIHMKLFRSQRNFYISGFALFLWLVLRRLVTLISAQASLTMDKDAAIRQAKSASDTAEKLLQEKGDLATSKKESEDNKGNIVKEEYEKEIVGLKQELDKSKEDLRRATIDVDTLKKQAQSVERQYDSLLSEYDKLKIDMEKLQEVKHDKKAD